MSSTKEMTSKQCHFLHFEASSKATIESGLEETSSGMGGGVPTELLEAVAAIAMPSPYIRHSNPVETEPTVSNCNFNLALFLFSFISFAIKKHIFLERDLVFLHTY